MRFFDRLRNKSQSANPEPTPSAAPKSRNPRFEQVAQANAKDQEINRKLLILEENIKSIKTPEEYRSFILSVSKKENVQTARAILMRAQQRITVLLENARSMFGTRAESIPLIPDAILHSSNKQNVNNAMGSFASEISRFLELPDKELIDALATGRSVSANDTASDWGREKAA